MKLLATLAREETGAAMAEYAMLLALIAVAVVGSVGLLRNAIISVFNKASSTLGSATK